MSAAKMFGPYKRIEDAIEADLVTFSMALDKKEYSFVVALKLRTDRIATATNKQLG
jgi:hypothetical protein